MVVGSGQKKLEEPTGMAAAELQLIPQEIAILLVILKGLLLSEVQTSPVVDGMTFL